MGLVLVSKPSTIGINSTPVPKPQWNLQVLILLDYQVWTWVWVGFRYLDLESLVST